MQLMSLAIPCYNEEGIIASTLKKVISALDGRFSFEILAGDDGSTDRTSEQVSALSKDDPRIRLVRSMAHLGKGGILMQCFRAAKGDILAFIDADLEIDVHFLFDLVQKVSEGYDIAIGSKVLHEDFQRRPLNRRIMTLAYNALVRRLLGSALHDHQAGLKAFRRESMLSMLPALQDVSWAWDTEVLVRAQMSGFSIAEVPIQTTYQRPSKISFVKTSSDMLTAVLSLYARGIRVAKANPGNQQAVQPVALKSREKHPAG